MKNGILGGTLDLAGLKINYLLLPLLSNTACRCCPKDNRLIMYAKKVSILAADHRSVIFLDDFDKADEEERRHSLLQYPNEITKIVERKQILEVSDNTTTVAPLPYQWQRRKKTNYLLHFRAFKSQKFLHEFSRDKISGTR